MIITLLRTHHCEINFRETDTSEDFWRKAGAFTADYPVRTARTQLYPSEADVGTQRSIYFTGKRSQRFLGRYQSASQKESSAD